MKALKKSLYLKFLLAYLCFGIACILIVAMFSSRFTFYQALNSQVAQLREEAVELAYDYSRVYTDGTIPEDFRNRVTGLAEYSGQRIWFISTAGQISYDSEETLEGSMIEAFNPTDFDRNYRIGSFYSTFNESMLSVLAPITANFKTYGYVILHIPREDLVIEGDHSLIPIYLTVGFIYLLSLILLIMLRIWVLHPMRRITEGAREFAAGNWKHRIDISSEDEFGYLANTLNVMAGDLNTAEENQKRFIANVSHDFRSPLTSIKGYLQAMIDGVIPAEMQEKYMRIVINESERLTNLTQSMLSLDSLERKNIHLEYSDFDLCPLIKNVCATFEGKCITKNISIELVFEAARMAAHADMGKIQQVIYNLLDNAIKFSPDNSEIRIQVSKRRDRLYISIRDHGVGIPKDNLTKIWTRFYKTDHSRGKDKTGTGLGLSIVKEIITAHGETIDVISTEGVGTEFIFRLQAAEPENAWDLWTTE